jgi:uncharacterized protein YkwD
MAFGGIANRPHTRIAAAAMALIAFAACTSSSRSADAPAAVAVSKASPPIVTTTTRPPVHRTVRRVHKAAKKVTTTTIVTTTTQPPVPVVHHYAPPVTQPPAPVRPAFVPPAAASVPTPAAVPAVSSSGAESQLVALINQFRQKHGIGPLSVHGTLTNKARLWAAHMASGGCGTGSNGLPNICHSNLTDGINVQWSALEENVGMCSPKNNVSGMESAFEGSPGHAANMLSTKVHYVGVGFAYVGNYMYVAEEFMG